MDRSAASGRPLSPGRASHSASGREVVTTAIMLAARQAVPVLEQVVPAPETAVEMADRDVVRVERENWAAGGRVAREAALKA